MATQAQITAVQQLYVSYLGRAADKAGLDFWSNAIANGTSTIESVATGLTLANEYTTKYAGLSNDALVDAVYTNVLGRTADAAGKAFWVSAFANGTVKADTFVSSLIQSLGAQDQATINNKTFVAQTYTDTAGDSYTPAGGAAVLVGVTYDPATVNTAVGNIATGNLPGLVPGVSLIEAKVAADAAVAAYGTAVAKSNPTFDGIADSDTTANNPLNVKDGTVTSQEATDALATANAARGTDTTATLNANASNAKDALALVKTTATTTQAGAVAVAAYDAAAAKLSTETGTVDDVAARAVAKGGAIGGLDAALTVTDSTVTGATLEAATQGATGITNATTLFNFYTNVATSSVDRSALVTELNKLGATGTTFLASADKALAINTATSAVATAKANLDSTVTSSVADNYVSKVADVKTTSDAVTKAAADDVKVAAAKAVVDQYKILTDAATKAGEDLGNFATDNASTVTLHDVKAAVPSLTTSTLKDVFYFGASKLAASDDINIGGFSTGDAVVLGSSFTHNSGALSTGQVGAQEFFLVQGANGVQIVAESAAYGSSTATANATTGVVTTAAGADAVAVITLTGVTIDHVAVTGNTVSYV